MKALLVYFFTFIILGLIGFFIYGIFWTYKLNARQASMGSTLSKNFEVVLPMQRDSNGYFCISGEINGRHKDFILDTKATSMARMESLKEFEARYWSSYPIPVKNVYGQQERLPLYEFDSLCINGNKLYKPLFKGISKSNALHYLLYKDIIGKDILQHFIWKFSLDDAKITLFSNKDITTLVSESEGFVKIENGLKNNVPLKSEEFEFQEKFCFDTGFQGCISIDKDLFERLKGKLIYEKYLNERIRGRIDTAFVFNDVELNLEGIHIPNCVLCYYPLVNRNLIGVRFIEKLNFILGYQIQDDSSIYKEDLFVQLRKNANANKTLSMCPDIGFDINVLEDDIFVTLLKTGGKASEAGLRIGDRVIEIDDINIDVNSVISGEVTSYLYTRQKIKIKVIRMGEFLTFDIDAMKM